MQNVAHGRHRWAKEDTKTTTMTASLLAVLTVRKVATADLTS